MSADTTAKVATTSENIENQNLQRLRDIFPEFVKDGEIDFDALKSFFDKENILVGPEKYALNWAGKSEAFKAIRVPATGTLVPDDRGVGEWDKTQNIFIEGDNLEVLKLLQKHYRDQIKMIYIDPPYNTGKDFIYKDNFAENKSDYYERTGQSEGGVKLTTNPESNGRYHSDWLTMMYPRLFLAKNLLKDDGVIFISIDDNEVANLRLIMDEIFGEENFVANFVWHSSTGGGIRSKFVNQSHQYVLCYARNIFVTETFYAPLSGDAKKQYKKEDLNGSYREKDFAWKNSSWGTNQKYFIECPDGEKVKPKDGYLYRFIKPTFEKSLEMGSVVFKMGRNSPLVNEKGEQSKWNIYIKKYLGNGTGAPASVIPRELVGINNEGTTELNEIFGSGIFESPKNVRLLRYLFELIDSENETILDFFAGSGTTAQAVMEQNAEDDGNRQWICVQLPEETAEVSEARKAGFNTISEIAIDRIRRLASYPKMKELIEKKQRVSFDFGFKSFRLAPSNYRQWSVLTEKDDETKLKAQMKLFAEKPLVDNCSEQSVVYEVLLKEGFDLNVSVKEEKKGNLAVWSATYDNHKMIITLASKLTREQVDGLGLVKDDTLVCLDSALDDSLKVNLIKNFNIKVI